MPEMSPPTSPKRTYALAVLNVPDEVLRRMAKTAPINGEPLAITRAKLKAEWGNLYTHLIATFAYREDLLKRLYSADQFEAIEFAYFGGALMTFELLALIAAQTGDDIPNPDAEVWKAYDTEPIFPALPGSDATYPNTFNPDLNMRWINLSFRGVSLPTEYPHVFDATVKMLSRFQRVSPAEIKLNLLQPNKSAPNLRQLEQISFFAGVAEIVLPLERHAEIRQLGEALERPFREGES